MEIRKSAPMDEQLTEPADCRTMTEVRAGVDALDRKIVVLLGKRMRFVEAAARIKAQRELVRDEARKAEVIANAAALARTVGVPDDLIRDLYETLVERSIAYEAERFDETCTGPPPKV